MEMKSDMNQDVVDELHRIVERGEAGVRVHSSGNSLRHELNRNAFIYLDYVNGHRRWLASTLGIEAAQLNPSTAQLAEIGRRYYGRREMVEGDL